MNGHLRRMSYRAAELEKQEQLAGDKPDQPDPDVVPEEGDQPGQPQS
jgi:hypothetical protein